MRVHRDAHGYRRHGPLRPHKWLSQTQPVRSNAVNNEMEGFFTAASRYVKQRIRIAGACAGTRTRPLGTQKACNNINRAVTYRPLSA